MSGIIALRESTPMIHYFRRDLLGNLQQKLGNTAAAREEALLDQIERLEGQIRDSSLVRFS